MQIIYWKKGFLLKQQLMYTNLIGKQGKCNILILWNKAFFFEKRGVGVEGWQYVSLFDEILFY